MQEESGIRTFFARHKKSVITFLLFIAYAGAVFWSNYQSLQRVQQDALVQFQLEAEKQASAVSYFFSERRIETAELAESEPVVNFFRNRDLGLSYRYGLGVNVQLIEDRFEYAASKRKGGSQPVFSGFMLIDSVLSGQKGAFLSALHYLILPTVVLATIPLAVIARQTRSAMLEVLGEDYVRTAKAKGMNPRRVIGVHALRNALIPVITTIGLQVGLLMAGAILTETIFSWPGIGKWMIEAVNKRDYFVVQSGLLLIALIIMAVNLIVDVLYAVINPRIRHN